jgi:glutaredoxin
MKLQLLLTISLFFALIFLLSGYSNHQPCIRIRPASIKFGKLTQYQQVKQTLKIKNTGNDILKVNLRVSCECLKIKPAVVTVAPDEIKDIIVQLNTGDYQGRIYEYIFIDSNDSVNPHITIVVEADIIHTTNDNHTKRLVRHENKIKKDNICISIFSTPGCRYCNKLKNHIIPMFCKKYNINISIQEYHVNQPHMYKKLISLEQQFGGKGEKLPVLLIGKKMLSGKKEIDLYIEEEIRRCIKHGGCKCIDIDTILDDDISSQYISHLKVIPVIIAGLIDGINPCAFTTIIFLLSYLTLAGRGPREILLIGILFTTTVFATYFIIGIGLLQPLQMINFRVIHYLVASVTFILGILSLIDYFRIKHGIKDELLLQLPWSMKVKIHQSIHKYGKYKGYVISSIILGFLISIFEFACTGQIYIPTLIYMLQLPEYRIKAISYLILYNLMFVLPLIIVFILGYLGVSSNILSKVVKKHIKIVKLITAIFFFSLTWLLIYLK